MLFHNSKISLAALLLAVGSCTQPKKEPEKVEKFPVTTPRVLDTLYYQEYVGEIQSVRNVEIRARLKGFVSSLHVDEGQFVKSGQLLFTFDDRVLREELLKARAGLKSAQAALKANAVEIANIQLLLDKNIVSRTQLDKELADKEALLARIEEAEAAISAARLNLNFARVTAPFDGVVNRLPYKAGSLVEEGTLLTTLSDNREVFVYFNISEREYLDWLAKGRLKQNNSAELVLANGMVFPDAGQIETVESEINLSSGNLAIRTRFPNEDGLLKHGASCKVRLPQMLKNAIVIDQKSTFEVQDKLFVYVLDSANRPQPRNIVPQLRLPNLYVVASGLSARDRIVREGVQLIKPGERIEPQPLVASVVSNS